MDNNTLTEMEGKALTAVRRGLCLSRADISRFLGISRPTASLIVETLLEHHALCESGRGKTSRGKSPTLLSPVPRYQYTIGLDLGYSRKLAGILLDGKNQIVRKEEMEFDASSLESIRQNAMHLIRHLSAEENISGIGIALPGIVDPKTGGILRSINPLFTSCNIRELFTQWTQTAVTVENRSRSAAFSEAFGGAGDQQKDFMLCSLGKSIGAAFWLNGSVFQGTHGAAGEIRTIRLTDGRTLEEALSPENVPEYSEDELVSICAEGLYQLTEIMDLEQIILTGRFTDFSVDFPSKLSLALTPHRKCRVVFSNYGRFSAARGAAMSAAEKRLFGQL